MLPDPTRGIADLTGTWWVAHTRPRFEKALAWDLKRRSIEYFLPMAEHVTFSGGRKRRVLLPLFPSYLFFCGDERDRYIAMTTNRVSKTLEVVDQQQLIDELSDLHRVLTAAVEVHPYTQRVIGKRCRITAGPFRDVEGIVVGRNNRARVALQISAIGQSAIMAIDADLLEPVPEQPPARDGAPGERTSLPSASAR